MNPKEILIYLIILILLCGCSKMTEMTEDWRLIGGLASSNAYDGGYITCENCGWYSAILIKKGIPKDILDFTDFVCPRCEVKGRVK